MAIFSEILLKMGLKLITESFLSKVAIFAAWEAAKRTKPVFDDEIIQAAAEALGVKLPS